MIEETLEEFSYKLKPFHLHFSVHQPSIGGFVYTGAAKGNGKELGGTCLLHPLCSHKQALLPRKCACLSYSHFWTRLMSPKEANFSTNTSENLAIYLNGKYKLGLVLRSGFKALLHETFTMLTLRAICRKISVLLQIAVLLGDNICTSSDSDFLRL